MILLDKRINKEDTPRTLLCTIDETVFQFVLLNNQDKPILAFGQSIENELDERRPDVIVDFLKKALSSRCKIDDIQKVRVAINAELFTLVPHNLDQLDDKRRYFDQIGFLSPRENILQDKVNQPDAALYYSVHEQLMSALKVIFPTADCCHYFSPFLNMVNMPEDDFVLAHVLQKKVNFLVYKKGVLQHLSSFTMEVKDDFLYHINTLYRIHEIDRESATLVLTGHVYADAPMVSEIKNYIRKIRFESTLSDQSSSDWEVFDRPVHYFYDFQLLRACA